MLLTQPVQNKPSSPRLSRTHSHPHTQMALAHRGTRTRTRTRVEVTHQPKQREPLSRAQTHMMSPNLSLLRLHFFYFHHLKSVCIPSFATELHDFLRFDVARWYPDLAKRAKVCARWYPDLAEAQSRSWSPNVLLNASSRSA
eukprot:4766393-Pleurochrysis_carterae.AAC.1